MKLISMADMGSSGSEDWLSRMISKFNRQSENSRIVRREGFVLRVWTFRTVMLPKVGGNYAEMLRGNAQYDVLCYTDEFLYGMDLADGSMGE